MPTLKLRQDIVKTLPYRRLGSLGRANLMSLDAARKKAIRYLGVARR